MREYSADELRTMLDNGEAKARFHKTEEAWYGSVMTGMRDPRTVREWSIGIDSPDGGTFGEWALEWVDLGHLGAYPRWCVFGDGIQAFLAIPGLAEVIADESDPDAIAERLIKLGFVDATARTREG